MSRSTAEPIESRTTAMGLWTDANQMLRAADILAHSGDAHVMMPTYYLLGHSMEVALKSFLLANGDDMDTLKFKIGHNLTKAARRVIATKCAPLSEIVKEHCALIEMLNPYYQAKEFEYRVNGYKRLPHTDALILFLGHLLNAIKPHAIKALPPL